MKTSARTSPRGEYVQQENIRIQASPSIAEKFPRLASAMVDLGYYDDEGRVRNSQIKYTVNLEHAKSIFRVACHNHECVRGDFDLSSVLAQAVFAKETLVSGEICCQGWRSRTVIDAV